MKFVDVFDSSNDTRIGKHRSVHQDECRAEDGAVGSNMIVSTEHGNSSETAATKTSDYRVKNEGEGHNIEGHNSGTSSVESKITIPKDNVWSSFEHIDGASSGDDGQEESVKSPKAGQAIDMNNICKVYLTSKSKHRKYVLI